MHNQDMVDFRVEISRELGAISENLRRIDEHLIAAKNTTQTIWRRVDGNTNKISKIEMKLTFMCAVISLVVSNLQTIINYIVK